MSNPPSSILIVKTSAIGDVIQTFPVLEYLRAKFPEARIDWVVEEGIAPLLRAHPQIDRVIEIRSRAWRKTPFHSQTRNEFSLFAKQLRETHYDVVFDLQGNAKSSIVTATATATVKVGFGWKSAREKCNLLVTHTRFNFPEDINIRLKYLGLVQNYFADQDPFYAQGVRLRISDEERDRLNEISPLNTPKLMVCFGSRWPNKRLKSTTLLTLLDKIASESNPSYVFIFGNEEEEGLAKQFVNHFQNRSIAVGNLSLPLWQAMMWEMDGVIAVDSAALHLCATTSTPSLSIFGPSAANCYKPLEARHTAIQGSCPYGRTFPARCPVLRTCPTGACMQELSADSLFASYKEWFAVVTK